MRTETPRERTARTEREELMKKESRKNYVALKRRVGSDITNSGLLSVRYKLEIVQGEGIALGRCTPDDTVKAYNEAIDSYLEKQQQ